MPPWLIWLGKFILLQVINIIAYAIMPKPKGPKPDEFKELEYPTAEAGKPIPVIFGEVTLDEYNYNWYGEKETIVKKVNA